VCVCVGENAPLTVLVFVEFVMFIQGHSDE
jgi:hypothetical protein